MKTSVIVYRDYYGDECYIKVWTDSIKYVRNLVEYKDVYGGSGYLYKKWIIKIEG